MPKQSRRINARKRAAATVQTADEQTDGAAQDPYRLLPAKEQAAQTNRIIADELISQGKRVRTMQRKMDSLDPLTPEAMELALKLPSEVSYYLAKYAEYTRFVGRIFNQD